MAAPRRKRSVTAAQRRLLLWVERSNDHPQGRALVRRVMRTMRVSDLRELRAIAVRHLADVDAALAARGRR